MIQHQPSIGEVPGTVVRWNPASIPATGSARDLLQDLRPGRIFHLELGAPEVEDGVGRGADESSHEPEVHERSVA